MRSAVLVTGGAGFLGSHLCDRLIEEDYHVTCVDNLHTGRMKNIAHLLHKKHFTFLNHNIIEAFDKKIDAIYHLACPASPPHYQRDPIYTLETCYMGTKNMLDLAIKYDVPVLFSSTSEVYGDPVVHPQHEGYWGNVNPIGIRSCYDEGKRVAETLCMDYYRKHKAKVKIVRIFNTYGPRMAPDDGRVVSNFICQALKGEALTIYGTGEQTRSFCYVSDLVEVIFRMMNDSQEWTGPVNIGNPGEFTMLELAEKVIKLANTNASIVYQPLPQDDPKIRCPDISLAAQRLGWKPKVTLDEGLLPTIAYFKGVCA